MNLITKLLLPLCFLTTLLGAATPDQEPALKPFVLGTEPKSTDRAQVVLAAKSALADQGFGVVGSFQPTPDATVVVVTHDLLKVTAAKTLFGGYGAVVRVAVTEVHGRLQVSYTNPTYFAAAYRLQDDLSVVRAKLEAALGRQQDFGSEKGLTAQKLRGYHYTFGMEKFDSLGKHELATFKTHAEAVAAVESGLAAGRAGVTKVYRVDLPGHEDTLFGVALAEGQGADKYVLDRIDFAALKSTAHLPYEILVSGGTVYHLYARFRIAIDFPDLSMMGRNSFMSIMSAPGAIKEALTAVAAGGK